MRRIPVLDQFDESEDGWASSTSSTSDARAAAQGVGECVEAETRESDGRFWPGTATPQESRSLHMRPLTALFVMPRPLTAWRNATALWITVAGWAAAAKRRFGRGLVVTPDRVLEPEEILPHTVPAETSAAPPRRLRLPTIAVTAAKDLHSWYRCHRARELKSGPWIGEHVALVWQSHDLWARAGIRTGRRIGCPVVSYVHAPVVWEAKRWGVTRPIWGPALERLGEKPQLMASDLVACVSDEVAGELMRFGLQSQRIIVSPMAVDGTRFSPAVSGATIRRRLELDNAFVFGWTGSFRKFHGADIALAAFAAHLELYPHSRLLLVGDGPEKAPLEVQAQRLGITRGIVFAGPVSHLAMPEWIASFDVGIVTAGDEKAFHYSPLKLREYMLCGKPVIAAAVGEMARLLRHEATALLYPARDSGRLAAQMNTLASQPSLAKAIGAAGETLIRRTGTWDTQLERILQRLQSLHLIH